MIHFQHPNFYLPLFFAGFFASCTPADIGPLDAGQSQSDAGSSADAGSLESVIDGATHLVQATYNNITSTVAVRIPPSTTPLDTLLIFHGTTMDDELSITAAQSIIDRTEAALTSEMALISVGYREADVLMGDDFIEAEAMLLWLQERAEQELGFEIDQLYLFGHSRGGYLVTQLNTLHATDGVIANAPGPIDLNHRCSLEESGAIEAGETCRLLREEYGDTTENSQAYAARSLLSFTSGHRSRILFIQGLDDKRIQLFLMPQLMAGMAACTDCAPYELLEVANAGHGAVFVSQEGVDAFNAFFEATK